MQERKMRIRRKIQALVIASLLFPTAILATQGSPEPITLKPGEAKQGITYSKSGSVSYQSQLLGKLDVLAGSTVLIAGPSPIKAYSFVVLWDGDSGGVGGYVIDGDAKKVVVKDIVKEFLADGFKVQNRIGTEVSWSPDEIYAVTPDIGEVQDHINIIDVKSGTSEHFNIGKLERGECEIQAISIKNSRWRGSREFLFDVLIEENPWSEVECPKNVKYPRYEAVVNVETKEIKFQKK